MISVGFEYLLLAGPCRFPAPTAQIVYRIGRGQVTTRVPTLAETYVPPRFAGTQWAHQFYLTVARPGEARRRDLDVGVLLDPRFDRPITPGGQGSDGLVEYQACHFGSIRAIESGLHIRQGAYFSFNSGQTAIRNNTFAFIYNLLNELTSPDRPEYIGEIITVQVDADLREMVSRVVGQSSNGLNFCHQHQDLLKHTWTKLHCKFQRAYRCSRAHNSPFDPRASLSACS